MPYTERMELFRRACEAVANAAPSPQGQSYAQAGLRMIGEPEHNPEDFRVQALYIRTNLGTWRGNEAKRVKALLDAMSGSMFWE